MQLNENALRLARSMAEHAGEWRVEVGRIAGATVIDVGVSATGGLEAGRRLAEVCMAGLGTVRLARPSATSLGSLSVEVCTDDPVRACLAAQYAGWPVQTGGFFGMGSGPMRLLRGKEPILERLGLKETATAAVGVLESSNLPSGAVLRAMAEECGVGVEQMTVLAARTRSLAGMIQIVARSVETALHKLAELSQEGADFRFDDVLSAAGAAPLPPPAADDLQAIGRTNDAILYGGEVVLWVRGAWESWRELAARIPSASSADHGRPFLEIFRRYDGDFYAIDPLLFGPAKVRIEHLPSGRTVTAGAIDVELLERSFRTTSAET